MKMDKKKWYRIDYRVLECQTMQCAPSTKAKSAKEGVQIASTTEVNLHLAITKELKSNKRKDVENDLDVVSVIDYLNKKANKQFKELPQATARLVKARYREGYKLDNFKKIIDVKVDNWLKNAHWHTYLHPSTLFNTANFENYLEETRGEKPEGNNAPKPFVLDFSKGED